MLLPIPGEQLRHGNADLVAHFYRRAFNLIRNGGTLGLIATNTIAQGDTRSSGLRWISEHGGEIYRATKRVQWPGEAAVVVSVLHIAKGDYSGTKVLDGTNVDTITAFLFHRGGHADPVRLQANSGKSFVGSYVLGMGFTFDDTDKKGVASPLAEMHRLIEGRPPQPRSHLPPTSAAKRSTPAPPTPTTATSSTSTTTPSAEKISAKPGGRQRPNSAGTGCKRGLCHWIIRTLWQRIGQSC